MEINNSISDSRLPQIKKSLNTRLPKFKRYFNNRTQARNTHSKRIFEKSKRFSSNPVDTLTCKSSTSKEKHPNLVNRYLFFKPHVSASSWIAVDARTGRYLDGRNEDDSREIASLTKIMTCMTVIQEVISRRRSFEELVKVSALASSIDGTIAELKEGDELRLWDILHALMLPSGNDAAIAIAEFIGGIIDPSQEPISAFLQKMNQNAKSLNLHDTFFTNPHGMSTTINVSSARSVVSLACFAMRSNLFCKIVGTKKYSCGVFNGGNVRVMEWANTNLLLEKGFSGVKTGITPAAGPCLCFCMERRKKKLMVVLLNSKSMEARWREAIKLWKYASIHLLH